MIFKNKNFLSVVFFSAFFFLGTGAVCFSQDNSVPEDKLLESALPKTALPESAQSENQIEERFAEVGDLSGEVQIRPSDSEGWKLAEKGMQIKQGGEVRTSKDSKVIILIDENGETGKVETFSNTWLRMAALSHSEQLQAKRTLIDLALGQILVTSEKLIADGTFQVRTPTSTSSVRGPRSVFEVNVEEE